MQNNELANLMPGNENKWTLPCSNGKVCRKKYRQPHGKLVGTIWLKEITTKDLNYSIVNLTKHLGPLKEKT